MNEQRRRQVYSGLALIALGLALWTVQRFEGLENSAVFFLVGGVFLAGYFYRREFGLLIPGAIICGIGMGMLEAVPMLVGIGCGFVGITLVAMIYERRFEGWPLIPGSILILVGLRELEILEYVFENWPLILVVIGVLILFGAIGRRKPSVDG